MKKWFKSPNSKRALMFYSKNALVEIAATSMGLILDSKSSFDGLIEEILDSSADSNNLPEEGVQNQERSAGGTPAARRTMEHELIKSVLKR